MTEVQSVVLWGGLLPIAEELPHTTRRAMETVGGSLPDVTNVALHHEGGKACAVFCNDRWALVMAPQGVESLLGDQVLEYETPSGLERPEREAEQSHRSWVVRNAANALGRLDVRCAVERHRLRVYGHLAFFTPKPGDPLALAKLVLADPASL